VTQYKGVPHQAINAMRAIAFVMEAVEDDVRCERLVSQVKESLAAEGNALSAKIIRATMLIDKATLAAKTTTRLSSQVAEDAAAVVQTIQAVSSTVASSATQLNETSTTYRDAIFVKSRSPSPVPELRLRNLLGFPHPFPSPVPELQLRHSLGFPSFPSLPIYIIPYLVPMH
jgi:hypothetical protein